MIAKYEWREVSRREPCVVCGRGDWCGRTSDGELIRCMRDGEAPSGYTVIRHHADGGTLYGQGQGGARQSRVTRPPRPKPEPIDWRAVHERCVGAMDYVRAEALSYELSVPIESLYAVGIGWHECRACYTFPERDAGRQIVGLSTRTLDGDKRFIGGGKRGLTIPDGIGPDPGEPLLIVEGASDVAACVTLGLQAVGRPSNVGGVDELAVLLDGYAGEIIVVGERDAKPDGRWPGRDGARSVAKELAKRLGREVAVTMPPTPYKDMRSFLEASDAHLSEDLKESLL